MSCSNATYSATYSLVGMHVHVQQRRLRENQTSSCLNEGLNEGEYRIGN